MMPAALSLRDYARQLSSAAEHVSNAQRTHHQRSSHPLVLLHGQGTVVEAAAATANYLRDLDDKLAELHGRARSILDDTAGEFLRLARWEEHLTEELEGLEESLTHPLGALVRSLGQQLDAECASALHRLSSAADALCPLPAPAPTIALSEYASVPAQHIDAISRAHLDSAQLDPGMREFLTHHPGQVLEFSEHSLSFALGDIDTAPAIITLVNGVGSADPSTWSATITRAQEIQARTGAAVVCWWGYNSPGGVLGGINQAPAHTGGERLRAFQHALRQRRQHSATPVPLVVVGHSYGSVVAGAAARDGGEHHSPLAADAVLFVGSPGVIADSVDDFHFDNPGADVVVAMGHADPIAWAAGLHGRDPTHGQFRAEVLRLPGGHSDYFHHPEFLERLRILCASNRPEH